MWNLLSFVICSVISDAFRSFPSRYRDNERNVFVFGKELCHDWQLFADYVDWPKAKKEMVGSADGSVFLATLNFSACIALPTLRPSKFDRRTGSKIQLGKGGGRVWEMGIVANIYCPYVWLSAVFLLLFGQSDNKGQTARQRCQQENSETKRGEIGGMVGNRKDGGIWWRKVWQNVNLKIFLASRLLMVWSEQNRQTVRLFSSLLASISKIIDHRARSSLVDSKDKPLETAC